MFIDIKSFFLNTGSDTQAVQLLDAVEQDETAGGCPKVDAENAEALCAEESPAMTIESSVRGGEQTCHQRTEDTADTMYRRSTHGVVDVQFVVDKLDRIDQHQSTDESDDDGSERRHQVAACRDAHQSGQHTIQRQ